MPSCSSFKHFLLQIVALKFIILGAIVNSKTNQTSVHHQIYRDGSLRGLVQLLNKRHQVIIRIGLNFFKSVLYYEHLFLFFVLDDIFELDFYKFT